MRTLIVGDMHVVVEELAECERLLRFIHETATEQQVGQILFLGDQYNNHGTVNVRVQEFWLRWFDALAQVARVVALKGNHDLDPTHDVDAHALMAHRHQICVVDSPTTCDGVLYLPYTGSEEQFCTWTHQAPDARVVVCHATFNGAAYENGFYAQDGFDLEAVPQQFVISGHIHAGQQITTPKGKSLWYPGAPRWRSRSDANVERFIYVMDLGSKETISPLRFSTAPYCKVIRTEVSTPKSEQPPYPLDSKDQGFVDIHGPKDFVDIQRAGWAANGWIVRPHPDTTATISVKESDGIAQSFRKFLGHYAPKNGTDRAVLAKLAQERLGV